MIAVLLLAAAYWCMLFNQLRIEWSANEQYAYGWFVPIVALGLMGRRWRDRPQLGVGRTEGPSGFLVAVGFVLLLLALLPIRMLEEANVGWRAPWWGHALVLAALSIWVLSRIAGPAWTRHFLFPILFVLVAVPWPTHLESIIVQRLMRDVAAITVGVIHLLGIPGVRHGNLIEVGSGVVSVDGACSGVRSLQTSLMASLMVGEMFRLRPWRRVTLIALGFGLAFVANVARTSLLTWGAATRGMDYMEQKLHDPAGLAVVVVVLGGIFGCAVLLAKLEDRRTEDGGRRAEDGGRKTEDGGRKTEGGGRRADGAAVSAASSSSVSLRGSAMGLDSRGETPPEPAGGDACATGSPTSDLHFRPFALALAWLVATEAATAYWFHAGDLRSVTNPVWSVNWPTNAPGYGAKGLTKREQSLLRSDEAKNASWQDEAGNQWSLIALRWTPENPNTFLGHEHTPDQCFTGAGWLLRSEPEPMRLKINGLELPFRRYVFEVDGKTAYAFLVFWDERSPGGQQELPLAYGFSRRVKAACEGKRNQGFKKLEISLIGPASEEESVAVLREGLEKLIQVGR